MGPGETTKLTACFIASEWQSRDSDCKAWLPRRCSVMSPEARGQLLSPHFLQPPAQKAGSQLVGLSGKENSDVSLSKQQVEKLSEVEE